MMMKSEELELVEAEVEAAESAKSAEGKEVIATRRACDATGTGLSHYILMDRRGK